MKTRIKDLLGIEFPILAFSHCRDVVAAVSAAGGFGVLGAVAHTPDELDHDLAWIREHSGGAPFGVDLLLPQKYVGADDGGLDAAAVAARLPAEHKSFLDGMLDNYGVPTLPGDEHIIGRVMNVSPGGIAPLLDVAFAHPIRLIASALGPPPPYLVERAHSADVLVAALAGSPVHAARHATAGADIIVAQGTEAGGHTGEVATMVLVPDVVDAIAPTPVLAAGGIGTGRQVAAAIALGAQGAWTGSIWLTTTESDLHPVAVKKLLAAGSRDAVRSRSLTGKPARQLRTPWTEVWEGPDSPGTLPMPLQFMLTIEAIQRINRYAHVEGSGAAKLIGSPVGQIVSRMNAVRPVKEVMYDLMNEFVDAVGRMNALVAEER
jgi:NAD(P)H-dependent flavin oxidoreductase YrpB (nitropropane dioxygenase family)